MHELVPIQVTPYMSVNPDVKLLEMTGKMLLNSGLSRYECYGVVKGHFEFEQASSIYTRVGHTLKIEDLSFEELSSEFVTGIGSKLTISHTKQGLVRNSGKPIQTIQQELVITASGASLKIRHAAGKYRQPKQLEDTYRIKIPEHTTNNPDLNYFTDLVIGFINKAGIILGSSHKEQNVA